MTTNGTGQPTKYDVILADPPWHFRNWSSPQLAQRGEKWARRNGRSPYDVMDLKDICALPVAEIAARDSILFCWATYPKLPEALDVIQAWGFTFKTVAFTWVKLNPCGIGFHFGLGYWTRQNPEICLLATRGQPKRIDNRVPNLVIAARGEHSKKPDEVRHRIVKLVGDLPRIELFARQRTPGWDIWGNQAPGGNDVELLVEAT